MCYSIVKFDTKFVDSKGVFRNRRIYSYKTPARGKVIYGYVKWVSESTGNCVFSRIDEVSTDSGLLIETELFLNFSNLEPVKGV